MPAVGARMIDGPALTLLRTGSERKSVAYAKRIVVPFPNFAILCSGRGGVGPRLVSGGPESHRAHRARLPHLWHAGPSSGESGRRRHYSILCSVGRRSVVGGRRLAVPPRRRPWAHWFGTGRQRVCAVVAVLRGRCLSLRLAG